MVAYQFSASKENALFQIFIGVNCFKGSWLNEWINRQLKCFCVELYFHCVILLLYIDLRSDAAVALVLVRVRQNWPEVCGRKRATGNNHVHGFPVSPPCWRIESGSFLCRLVVAMTTQQPSWCIATVVQLVLLTTKTSKKFTHTKLLELVFSPAQKWFLSLSIFSCSVSRIYQFTLQSIHFAINCNNSVRFLFSKKTSLKSCAQVHLGQKLL